MSITVIEQSTSERNEETVNLWETIRPLLDKGYSYMGACIHIGKVPPNTRNSYYKKQWFRDLREYGESMGYDYQKYSGKGRR